MERGLIKKVGKRFLPFVFAFGLGTAVAGCYKVPEPKVVEFNGSKVYISPYEKENVKEIMPDGTHVSYIFLPYVDMNRFYGKGSYELVNLEINGKDYGNDFLMWNKMKKRADSILSKIDSAVRENDRKEIERFFR
jgi:hypothetical protein